jgi:hypothetical protein
LGSARVRLFCFLLFFVPACSGSGVPSTSPKDVPPFPAPREKETPAPTFDPKDSDRTFAWIISRCQRWLEAIGNEVAYDLRRKEFLDDLEALKEREVAWRLTVESVFKSDAGAGVHFLPIETKVGREELRISVHPCGLPADQFAASLRPGDRVTLRAIIDGIHFTHYSFIGVGLKHRDGKLSLR